MESSFKVRTPGRCAGRYIAGRNSMVSGRSPVDARTPHGPLWYGATVLVVDDNLQVRELTRLLWKFETTKNAAAEQQDHQRPERGRRRRGGTNS